jgi:hypothetical protein
MWEKISFNSCDRFYGSFRNVFLFIVRTTDLEAGATRGAHLHFSLTLLQTLIRIVIG